MTDLALCFDLDDKFYNHEKKTLRYGYLDFEGQRQVIKKMREVLSIIKTDEEKRDCMVTFINLDVITDGKILYLPQDRSFRDLFGDNYCFESMIETYEKLIWKYHSKLAEASIFYLENKKHMGSHVLEIVFKKSFADEAKEIYNRERILATRIKSVKSNF